MTADYDLVIVGSGFGGSLTAMIARRIGLSVLILEKGCHPRFAIGESTSPLANLIIEQLADKYDLPRLRPLTAYGSWLRRYPELDNGLKRGFTFYQHQAGLPYRAMKDRSNQLMVAASPNDEVADTHWLRADVDAFLLREAISLGAKYVDEAEIAPPIWQDDGAKLSWTRNGKAASASARLIIDATGPRGFLSRALNLVEIQVPNYPATQALYSHFTGVRRCDRMPEFAAEGTPYPADDAALHHVFDDGWMWVLRFRSGITSAGFAVTDMLAREVGLHDGEAAWHRLLARFPSLQAQFAEATPVRDFTYAPRLTHRSSQAAGPGWAMLPSAAAFVDPLFSTGFPLTLLGIERLALILEQGWERSSLHARLVDYAEVTLAEADATAEFIGACYAAMPQFPLFAAMSMFYFTAASYSEMARRLDKRHLATRFLASNNRSFTESLKKSAKWLRTNARSAKADAIASFQTDTSEAVSQINIAGLADQSKQNWYGVDLKDIVTGADKLEMSSGDVREVIRTAAWAKANSPHS